jgi:glucose/arabinose dehydrogenase
MNRLNPIRVGGLVLAAALITVGAFAAIAQRAGAQGPYIWQQFATGFPKPTALVTAPDNSRRLFVVEQAGTIRIVKPDGLVIDSPFLDITPRVLSAGNEQGLLGLAFPADYAQTGTFYVAYTNKKAEPTLARVRVSATSADKADATSIVDLLSVPHPFPNHNGGEIVFGPDGYLYWGIGDGGAGGDPYDNGQNPQTLLGKILRLDVNAETYKIPDDNPFKGVAKARPELWAIGLRNPWRFSFDAKTNDFYIADVGQNVWEEIDFQPAGSKGGQNYGWALYEGEANFKATGATAKNPYVFPVHVYSHGDDGCSVTGGYVYRGKALPALDGAYVYGDYCSGRMWTLRQVNGQWTNTLLMDTGMNITSFGLDADGELYMADRKSAAIFKLVAAK